MELHTPLNFADALAYVTQVKQELAHQPKVYEAFLAIMKDFKGQAINGCEATHRVAMLFQDHPNLLQGFRVFLPRGPSF
jgi:paired amphipathic helix protein Sin3a